MKKIALLFLLIFAIARIHAQNYQFSFTGTGASITVDSVKVENLTQNTSLSMGGSDILNLLVTVGINELNTSAGNTVQIYPNPMTGTCSIGFDASAQGKTILKLYDISGKEIVQWQDILIKGHHTFILSGVSSGIYTLKIASEKYSYSAKIISSNSQPGIAEMKHIEARPAIEKQNTISDTRNIDNLKSSNSIIDMPYTTGDILKISGLSGGVYKSVTMLIPTQSQTVTFTFYACTDADSNHYAAVQVGTQIWMVENLKTIKYRNGDPIPLVTDGIEWGDLTTGAYCNFNNDDSNSITYGRLYNWFSVNDSRNIAPIGWHVPTQAEWVALTNYLGGVYVAGGKLKESGTTHWLTPNTGATNEAGFTGLPARWRDFNGTFIPETNEFTIGGYWSATEYNSQYAFIRYLNYQSPELTNNYFSKEVGFSIRCIKD